MWGAPVKLRCWWPKFPPATLLDWQALRATGVLKCGLRLCSLVFSSLVGVYLLRHQVNSYNYKDSHRLDNFIVFRHFPHKDDVPKRLVHIFLSRGIFLFVSRSGTKEHHLQTSDNPRSHVAPSWKEGWLARPSQSRTSWICRSFAEHSQMSSSFNF